MTQRTMEWIRDLIVTVCFFLMLGYSDWALAFGGSSGIWRRLGQTKSHFFLMTLGGVLVVFLLGILVWRIERRRQREQLDLQHRRNIKTGERRKPTPAQVERCAEPETKRTSQMVPKVDKKTLRVRLNPAIKPKAKNIEWMDTISDNR